MQQPEREFDYLAPYNALLKYEWNYNSTSLCTMHGGGGFIYCKPVYGEML